MTWTMGASRRRPGRIVAALLIIVSDVFIAGAQTARLLASDEVALAGIARRGDGIDASMRRLAPTEASRLMQDEPPAADSTRALCRASLVEKVASVFSLGVGSIMFGYGLREKEKHDTIWTPDGKSEVVLGAAAIGLSFWLFQDIRNRARKCETP